MTRSLPVLLALTAAAPAQAPAPAAAMPAELMQTLHWRCIGPSRGGRASGVAGVVGDPRTYYFAACGGGVWKTTDAGRSWGCVSDGFFGGSVGAVAVAPSDANVVYAGTGEKTVRGNVSSGQGVWRSTDAGKTWKFCGLADTRHVGRIRVHPRDPDLVYVAAMGHISGPNAERGVFRSTDGGENWDKVLFVGEHAGAVDLCFDPSNPRILFASTWRVLRTPHSLESGGDGSGLWRSSDGGSSWTDITRRDGLPGGTVGIIGVAVSPADSSRVWAQVEAEDGGLFRSDDGGDSWQRVSDDRNLRQRAWYYTRVYADPADRDVVYVLNVSFHKSKDGGRTFDRIRTPHGDNHDLWIDPHDPRRMVQCNDGGANVSFDGGDSWTAQDNQPTAQLYRVTTDTAFPYRVLGAQQDNSTVRIASRGERGRIGERDWEPTAGGESGHVVADPRDPDVVYGGSYGGYLQRVNHRTGERRRVDVWPDNPLGWGAGALRYRFQWNFPLFFSPHDPTVLYAAANVLFRTSDEGQSWQAISTDLTRNDPGRMQPSGGPITKDNTGVEYYCTIFAACESPVRKGVLWCGSDDGLVHVSRNGGVDWQQVTPPWPEWTMVNCIEPHPTKAAAAYVAATAYKLDDFTPYLFRTDDWGESWTRIDAGIDRSHFTRAIRCDPARAGLLYAGTERGAYVSFDDGARWQPLQLDLPVTPITDLAVKDGDLVAATQGRSFWILDDLAHLHQLDARQAGQAALLYAPEPTWRLGGGGRGRRGGAGEAGENPPSGAVARVWLRDDPGKTPARLEWLDGAGNVVHTMATAAEDDDDRIELAKGMNRFEWDLRYPGARRVPGMILWGAMLDGPTAVPGTYRVRFTLGEGDAAITQEREFEVRKDPRNNSSIADLQAQFTFLVESRDKLTQTHDAILRTRDLRGQVRAVLDKAAAEAAELKQLGDEITAEAKGIEEALYQTRSKSPQDPLNFPIKLNNKLANLMSTVASSDCRPTAQALAVRTELVQAIDIELGRLERLESDSVPRFNGLAADAGVPHLTPRAVESESPAGSGGR